MKCLVLLVFVAFAAAQLSPQEQVDSFLRKTTRGFDLSLDEVKDCVKTTNTTEEDLLYASDLQHDALKRFKRISCFLTCGFKKAGTFVGMKVNVPKVMEDIAKNGAPLPPDKEKRLRDDLNACNAEVTEANDECAAAYQLVACFMNKTRPNRQLF
ncbi:uncharacterized protein LOC116430639 [Nomia melanderi]|uniref:uncharacterized protein LOC116430639 n=1 Tax=Nomia melanderi TaxID=2448451 RepID=UPI003FCE59E4